MQVTRKIITRRIVPCKAIAQGDRTPSRLSRRSAAGVARGRTCRRPLRRPQRRRRIPALALQPGAVPRIISLKASDDSCRSSCHLRATVQAVLLSVAYRIVALRTAAGAGRLKWWGGDACASIPHDTEQTSQAHLQRGPSLILDPPSRTRAIPAVCSIRAYMPPAQSASSLLQFRPRILGW